jgi:site-specific DNA-methyltransferase (adenine-specific)
MPGEVRIQVDVDAAGHYRFRIRAGAREITTVVDPDLATSFYEDLRLLGEHMVKCGDSTDADSVSGLLDGQKADTLWTDPPYGVSYVGKTKLKLTIDNDGSAGLREFLDKFLRVAGQHLSTSAPFYIAHPPGPLAGQFYRAVEDAGWRIHQGLVWVKDSMVLGHSDYHYQHEPILYGYTHGDGRPGRGAHAGTRWEGDNGQVTVFQIPRPKRSEQHPTMKPVELVRRCLVNSTPARGLVYEPFGGSGSTVIACEQLGLRCRALELSPGYCDVIVSRWESHTHRSAVLASSSHAGATFDQTREGRRLEAQDQIKEEVLERLAGIGA